MCFEACAVFPIAGTECGSDASFYSAQLTAYYAAVKTVL